MNKETVDKWQMVSVINAGKKNGWTDDYQKIYLYGRYGIKSRKEILANKQIEIVQFFMNTNINEIIGEKPTEPEDGQMDMLGRVYNKKNKSWEVNTND